MATSRARSPSVVSWLGAPREAAYAALFLASEESSYVTGTELVVDSGHTAQ
ncbi:MAG: SDR family oxidoreductase [Pontimonas sp.]